jgi:hypothetical protein
MKQPKPKTVSEHDERIFNRSEAERKPKPKTGLEKVPAEQADLNALEQFVVGIVDKRLCVIADEAFMRRPTSKKEGRAVKKSVAFDHELWTRIETECPGPLTWHVQAAMRMYLDMRKKGKTE